MRIEPINASPAAYAVAAATLGRATDPNAPADLADAAAAASFAAKLTAEIQQVPTVSSAAPDASTNSGRREPFRQMRRKRLPTVEFSAEALAAAAKLRPDQ